MTTNTPSDKDAAPKLRNVMVKLTEPEFQALTYAAWRTRRTKTQLVHDGFLKEVRASMHADIPEFAGQADFVSDDRISHVDITNDGNTPVDETDE